MERQVTAAEANTSIKTEDKWESVIENTAKTRKVNQMKRAKSLELSRSSKLTKDNLQERTYKRELTTYIHFTQFQSDIYLARAPK